MKRLRRILFNGVAAVSALLCVATCVLWVRSYWGTDYVSLSKVWPPLEAPGYVEINAGTVRGRVQLSRFAQVYPADKYPQRWRERACEVVGRNLTGAEWASHMPNAGPRRKTCDQWPLDDT